MLQFVRQRSRALVWSLHQCSTITADKVTRRVFPIVRIATRRLSSEMAPGDSTATKRKSPGCLSPPPPKRRAPSDITKSAVASFFTPTSQKPKDNTKWTERGSSDDVLATLLVAKYEPEGFEGQPSERRKIAAFDMDGTLITTSSGKTFAQEATDWKWWTPEVAPKLKELYDQNYKIVIFSNQAGLTLHADPKAKAKPKAKTDRVLAFKQKCAAVLSQLDLPITLYAATGKDIFRKPRPGMWNEFCADYGVDATTLDLENSVFVGDAGGRTAVVVGSSKKATAKDFSCSDRNFAHNVGLRFLTPEEFFLGQEPRDFVRDFDLEAHPFPDVEDDGTAVLFEKKHDTEIVMFCGPPGGGKSTFYWKHLKPLGYERVNQDILKTRDKCVATAGRHLEAGKSVAIDNTNADPASRAIWVALAKKHNVPIRCVWFKTTLTIAQHNDAVRSLNTTMNPESRMALPTIAFAGFKSRFREPLEKEGFEVIPVEFRFSGTQDEHKVWARYWT